MYKELKGRAILMVLIGTLLLQYPIIALFESDDRILGVPAFLLFLIGTWVLLIVLLFRLTRYIDSQENSPLDE